jgi:hypothetical protein
MWRKAVAAAVAAAGVVGVAACTSTSTPSLVITPKTAKATPAKSSVGVMAPSMMPSSMSPTMAPSMSSSSMASTPMTAPMGTPECQDTDLSIALTVGNGTAGSVYYQLKFMNISMAACTMTGYPGVIATDGMGSVGPSAVRAMGTVKTVTLAPGDTGTAQLQYKEAATTEMGCGITMTTGLNIIPPNRFDPVSVPFSNQVCSGSVSVLTISPVV